VVAVNFGDAPVNVTYEGLARPGSYTDWFAKRRVLLGPAGSVDIPAHSYRVFVQ
jgi:hypothetical protein